MYFVSLSPFILDHLCLVDCEFLCLCLYSCICIFITFYFRSLVSWVLWVPLFVFIFLYFISRSPFILDLLCLVDCGFLCLCLSSCILYLDHIYFRSLMSCGLWVPLFVFIFLCFVFLSPFILDLLWLVYCGFLCLCLYSCILYLDHLLF